MKEIIVGIGDVKVSGDPGLYISTYALGSCVAIILYDQIYKIAGMAHIALYDSNINIKKSNNLPGYYADTAVTELISLMSNSGAFINIKNITVKIVGGAAVYDTGNFFDIGKKNILALRNNIKQKGLKILKEDVGGDFSRTVKVEISTGNVIVSNMEMGKWEL